MILHCLAASPQPCGCRRRRCMLQGFMLLAAFVFLVAALTASEVSIHPNIYVDAADTLQKGQQQRPGLLRRLGRSVKNFLSGRGEKQQTAAAAAAAASPSRPAAAATNTHVQLGGGGAAAGVTSGGGGGGGGGVEHRGARSEATATETTASGVRTRGAPADPAKAVWQSLGIPHFRSAKVQDVLEYWHVEALSNLFDSFHLQELLRSYLTVLEWGAQLFLPHLLDNIRNFTNAIISTVFDVDVCSKRLLYLSGIPVVSGRGSQSLDIEGRKTKALHTLGVYYVLRGRLLQLISLLRDSSKLFCKELTRKHQLTAQLAKVLMPFSRLSRYSLDSLEYLLEYYKELNAAVMGVVVYPLLVTRTYSRLHRSLQTAGQFFAACVHAHKIGITLQHDIAEIRGLASNSPT